MVMKSIFTIFITLLISTSGFTQDNYKTAWESIRKLERKGLYNKALKEVNTVFLKSVKSKNHEQVIKSVFFELRYNTYLKEDDYILGIHNLESLIQQTASPAKELLHSITAEVYWGYYNANSWKYQQRTEVESNVKLEDIRTWDLKRIADKVIHHYQSSLKNETISQNTLVDDYKLLIQNTTKTKAFRPTLYDFLAHKAIAFYSTNSFNVPGSAATFTMNNIKYFGSNTSFSQIQIKSPDLYNTKYYAALNYQHLTKFRLNQNNQSALLMLELDRLQFCHKTSISINKDSEFEEALTRLTLINPNNVYTAEALYLLANLHNTQGNDYSYPDNVTNKWERQLAVNICEETIKRFPKSHGALQCASLMNRIKRKTFHFTGQEAIIPNKKSKLLINYKNIETLYLKIVPIKNYKTKHDNSYKEYVHSAKGIYNETIKLKNNKDFRSHEMECLIPELELGQYVIVASSSPIFSKENSKLAFHTIWVTDLTFQTKKDNDIATILVTERADGHPVEGATVDVFNSKYDYKSRKYISEKFGTYKTDALGLVHFTATKNVQSYNFSATNHSDYYYHNQQLYLYKSRNNKPTAHITTQLFTDRKIYRPGQTVYFKGISYESYGNERSVKANWESTVTFYDVNYQKIKDVTVTTNKYGSFSGSFEAPIGLLTGSMTLTNEHGRTRIRVEEYKRPKFSTIITPLTGEYKVGDDIEITGEATAFAGNTIDGATVSYRITRTTRFNYYRWGWYGRQNSGREISYGNTTTDENGKYTIHFEALPDLTKDPKDLPIFDYSISATVTDINGESHSTTSTVSIGYQSLVLGHNLPTEFSNKKERSIKLTTTNLNGQPIFAKGKVKIYPLVTPNQTYRKRLWSEPDVMTWTESEFKSLFPLDEYKSENDYHTWPKGDLIFSSDFDTELSTTIDLPKLKKWKSGMYFYESVAKDKNGIDVKSTHYFEISNYCDKKTSLNTVFSVKPIKTTVQPGEKAKFLISTSEDELFVFYTIEHKGKTVHKEWIELSDEQELITIDVEEKHRGNFSIHFSTMKNNRSFSISKTVKVPYKNKRLDLAFSTFRNKLLPGQAEEWTMTIKNKKGEKEMAELLATLYDASLDQLYTPNQYLMNIYRHYNRVNNWSQHSGIGAQGARIFDYNWFTSISAPYRQQQKLNHFGYNTYYNGQNRYFSLEYPGEDSISLNSEVVYYEDDIEVEMEESANQLRRQDLDNASRKISSKFKTISGAGFGNGNGTEGKKAEQTPLKEVKARTNFNETAFFYPQLETDKEGSIKIKFTIPESLTKWRFLGLAHTQDLKFGSISEEVITQKDLMVVPNVPRFLREGDKITLSTKISNVSKEDLNGKVMLQLIDPTTNKVIDELFTLTDAEKSFTTKAGQSTVASWSITIPYHLSAVTYKFVAQAGNFSDGEENVLPILSNRMLVTESLPMPIRGKETKIFSFDKLKNAVNSSTLRHHKYTLEFTSNPAWYAVQAMPYMMEYPYDCAEQTFTRYYSNAIASHIMNSSPKIKQVVEDWGTSSPDAFLSNLNKNQELKSVILEETPWVLDANSETQSKKNLSVLLDMTRMSKELNAALNKTITTQSSNGGWPWFPGMKESRYITQHIITGMGHLDHLGIKAIHDDRKIWKMITKGVHYLDTELVKDFEKVKKHDRDYLKNQHLNYYQIQYLYARSYFQDISKNRETREAYIYYLKQAKTYWLNFNIYAKGMLGLAAHRSNMSSLATDIVNSLKDNAIQHEEFGMYWKSYTSGYRWYEAPVETQALMIELFDEVGKDQESVENLKIWLLKQKQTTNWKTTKQTTEAVYALLLKGTDLLASNELVEITVGGQPINYTKTSDDNPYNVNTQAGTGYFKTNWTGNTVKPEMGNVTVKKNTTGVAWGALYWQYFEDLDKITHAETNLKLEKQLFKLINTTDGQKLTQIKDNNTLKIGDKVRVRIELRTDRNLEYVHLKDMRSSGFEPINVLSMYKYREGLGYYEATKDASTNFFFDYIPKGTYVFEYDLRVQHKGQFSNGIATIQCMYAPEFTSHSDGLNVVVE